MQTKLTLSVEKHIIEKAKLFAKMHNTSISQIVEEHLERVVAVEQSELSQLSPLTRLLMGSASGISTNKPYKELIAEARSEKYMENV